MIVISARCACSCLAPSMLRQGDLTAMERARERERERESMSEGGRERERESQ